MKNRLLTSLCLVVTVLAVACGTSNPSPELKDDGNLPPEEQDQGHATAGTGPNMEALAYHQNPIVDITITGQNVGDFPDPMEPSSIRQLCDAEVVNAIAGAAPTGTIKVTCAATRPLAGVALPTTPPAIGTTMTVALAQYDLATTNGVPTYQPMPVTLSGGPQARTAQVPTPIGFGDPIPVDIAAYQQLLAGA
jgi:hypothetical protein